MANETTATTLDDLVAAEVISDVIKDYLIDAPVIAPLCQYRSLAGRGSNVISFPLWAKDTGADVTEGTAMSNTSHDTTQVSVTVAQVGILREVTRFVSEASAIGPAALFDAVVEDGKALVIEMLEDDLAALFASFSGGTAGSTGVDMSVANWVEAISKLRTAKVRGSYVAVLDDQAAYDLMASVAASQGTIFGSAVVDASILNANSDGYLGSLFNVPAWVTNLTDTANAGADVVSGMWVSAASNEKHCPASWATLWLPTVAVESNVANTSTLIATTMAYGTACTHPGAGIKLVTDA